LVDGGPAYRRICRAVEAARCSVWVTVAFIDRDTRLPGGDGSFFDLLDRAAARGLDVRALFWREPLLAPLASDPLWRHFEGNDADRAFLEQRRARFAARWDHLPRTYCHHQKSWVIDAGENSEVAFVGGINIQDSSMVEPGHPPAPHGNVHDAYIEIKGPAATDVHHNFVQRWNEASERHVVSGCWPDASACADLVFPSRLSEPPADVPVQIQRTIRRGAYTDATPAVGANSFPIGGGEKSTLEQYLRAIEGARSTIYIEDLVLASPQIFEALVAAMDRGVEVVSLVPATRPPPAAARSNPERTAFLAALSAVISHRNFTLVAIAALRDDGSYEDIFVHAKICLIDDEWATIGSTNIANRSFHGDTELNASFWHPQTVRSLRRDLLSEHLGRDTGDLDDRAAFQLYRETAHSNSALRREGKPLDGLAWAIEPASYP
jgi:phosphatidylserine/phosphatidylglycerophosphate/cardiolipin synthase-like enzyme